VIAVEPLRHHPRHQVGELLVAAGFRQGSPPDVIAEIEVRVFNPDRPAKAERYRAEFPAVERRPRQAPGDVGQELLLGRYRPVEYRG
jgi:hypothetical protein